MAEGQGARLTAEQARVIRDKWAHFLEDFAAEEVTEALDALAAENAELRAALEEVYAYHQQGAPLYPSDSSWETVREALTRRADGGA